MRIALSGYYGSGNTGDEAILAATLAGLRQRLPEAEIVVLSSDPVSTAAEHQVEAQPRWSASGVWRTVRAADLVLSGGGGLLQDSTSSRSLMYYLAVLEAARLARTPYAIFAQGVGPLRGHLARWATGRCVRRAAAITVRDQPSAELLHSIGIAPGRVEVTADPAAALSPAVPERIQEILGGAGVRADEPLLGVAVRPWGGTQAALEAIAETARRAADELGLGVLLLPFQRAQDLEPSRALAARVPGSIVLDGPLCPAELMGLVARLEMLVAMRLHALIFAAAQAVPALGVVYDPKVRAFCQQVGQAHVDTAESSRFAAAFRDAWEARAGQAEERHQCARRLRVRAERNFDVVEDLARTLA